jgi:enterochelin esterase-like enzyme
MPHFDFVGNRVFDDRYSAFAPQSRQVRPGSPMFERDFLDTGVKVKENGDVEFGLYAPRAQAVNVVFGTRADRPLAMTKRDDGIWRAVLAYDPAFCGPKAFHFDVDGAPLLSPYCPQYYSHGMSIHYVDIPDPNTPFILMRDVPHGSVTSEFYWSDSLETWQRCLVYTPPGYEGGGQYPVLFLQHGGGENETSWIYNGRAAHIMDNLAAEGKIVPFIIVMTDGMVRGKGEEGFSAGKAFERTLLDNCLPFIEKKYRVKADKWNRAIAGFSMGSMQASIIGLTNCDKFAYIGLLSGFMRRLGRNVDSDTSLETNPHLKLLEDKERFLSEIKLYYRGIGSDDLHIKAFYTDDDLCAARGYAQYPNITRRVVEHYPHDWAVLRILLHDFAQRIFKN